MANETQAAAAGKTMRITLVRSPIGYTKRQKETVKALGLHRMHETIDRPDTPEMRAMVESIGHMVRIEE
jgi:large subunit ribosomal protein L30